MFAGEQQREQLQSRRPSLNTSRLESVRVAGPAYNCLISEWLTRGPVAAREQVPARPGRVIGVRVHGRRPRLERKRFTRRMRSTTTTASAAARINLLTRGRRASSDRQQQQQQTKRPAVQRRHYSGQEVDGAGRKSAGIRTFCRRRQNQYCLKSKTIRRRHAD